MNGKLLGDIDGELTTNQVFTALENLSRCDISHIQLLGGEPLQRNDIIDIFNKFEQLKIPYGFNTNGLKLNQPLLLKYIEENKSLRRIVCSLDGPTKEINDMIRGKNVFDKVCHNLMILNDLIKAKKLNIETIINFVICQKNKNYIEDMVRLCIDLGMDSISFLELIVQGNALQNDSLTDEETIDVALEIAKVHEKYQNKIKIIPQFARPLMRDYISKRYAVDLPTVSHMCGAGVNFGYIDNKGILYPCDRFADMISGRVKSNIYNLTKNKFAEIWQKNLYSLPYERYSSEEYSKLSPCNECSYFKESCFPCYLVYKNEMTLCKKIFNDMRDTYEQDN